VQQVNDRLTLLNSLAFPVLSRVARFPSALVPRAAVSVATAVTMFDQMSDMGMYLHQTAVANRRRFDIATSHLTR
jgi:hypothetical protein